MQDAKFQWIIQIKNQLFLNYWVFRGYLKIDVILPTKVLFLGNSNAGKSTFVDYFIQVSKNRKFKKLNSTPILQILNYKKDKKNHNLPQAILYDFGGQDYYHGVYKAFLTNDSTNLIFWKKENDNNETAQDRGKEDFYTQNFNRNYWIHQLNFLHQYKNKELPIFLIQTHADIDKRVNFKGDFELLNIKNEFFVALEKNALKNEAHKSSLDYFEKSLISKINEKREIKSEPQWYIDFLEFVYNYDSYHSIDLKDLKKHYKWENNNTVENFKDDLDQLSKKGLILYYKDNDKLNNKAWLNPTLTVQHIHENILKQEILTQHKGKIDKKLLDEYEDITALLIENKVIYLDQLENKYIVPGYLPDAKKDNEDFFIFSDFNDINFVLKFENFIPFGFINQIICKYGGNPEKKMYWKDQLIFTTEDKKAKILINLNFKLLEISVSIKKINSENIDFNQIENDIFITILDLFWDNEDKTTVRKYFDDKVKLPKNENEDIEFKDYIKIFNLSDYSPKDLYISLNNKDFVHHNLLEDREITTTSIVSYPKNADGSLNKQNGKSINTINFKNFTTNPNIKNMKKIFISYSR